jgi:hypothetical protein
MKMKSVISNLAVMVCFGVLGLMSFTEDVRTVQVLGLFAAGMVVGASFSNIVHLLKPTPKA